ncbi:hypothetical protein [Bradyrhizobium sp.]|uniref:hypothetical protein n=1 Tax=Bradyrhizobium sp. TaxID=376 RepID=UPI0025B89508|nr:hypothetical protein [Bradyrhizobium sp.]MBV8919330.1 hypothetical protein [Bradyrhizobium sp.]
MQVIALLAAIACACPVRAETISVGGVTRSFTVALPAVRPAPLVIVLHGAAQSETDMMTRTMAPSLGFSSSGFPKHAVVHGGRAG